MRPLKSRLSLEPNNSFQWRAIMNPYDLAATIKVILSEPDGSDEI
jgi:hypothetical protein